MPKPLATMMGLDHVASALRGASQGDRGARAVLANTFLDQSPRRFNGIEVVRVGRQELYRRAACLNQAAGRDRLVRAKIVEQDHVPGPQLRGQSCVDPAVE